MASLLPTLIYSCYSTSLFLEAIRSVVGASGSGVFVRITERPDRHKRVTTGPRCYTASVAFCKRCASLSNPHLSAKRDRGSTLTVTGSFSQANLLVYSVA